MRLFCMNNIIGLTKSIIERIMVKAIFSKTVGAVSINPKEPTEKKVHELVNSFARLIVGLFLYIYCMVLLLNMVCSVLFLVT